MCIGANRSCASDNLVYKNAAPFSGVNIVANRYDVKSECF